MVNDFLLPDVGEGLTEAEIVNWHVKVGDVVQVNDVLCEIETAKSVVELPSPYAGTVQALLAPEGETLDVGTPIVRIGDGAADADGPIGTEGAEAIGEAPAPAQESQESQSVGHDAGEQPLTLVGSGPKEAAVTRRPRVTTPAGAGAASGGSGVLAKPAARLAAREAGIDLATVTPSREDGVITAADIPVVGASVRSGALSAPRPGERETREPVKGVRKAMSEAMVASAFTAPHVTVLNTVDVTRTVELVERLKTHAEFRDVRVSPLLIVAKACLLALRRTPLMNSTWDAEAGEVVVKHYVNLGIAAATPRGLLVPNLEDAHELSLRELAGALDRLVTVARDGKTPPSDLTGGTFSITNVGPFGIDAGTPIINPGDSGILCVGAIKRRPWVVGDQVVPRHVVTLSVSFDHRHIDGQTGSRFLADVSAILEDPAAGLLY